MLTYRTSQIRVARISAAVVTLLDLTLPVLAQTAYPTTTIIACEGPEMPAACPLGSNVPKTMDDASRDLAERQAAEVQQLQLARQRIGLKQQLNQNRILTAAKSQTAQPFAPLSPPNFSAAAQLLSSVGTGNPK